MTKLYGVWSVKSDCWCEGFSIPAEDRYLWMKIQGYFGFSTKDINAAFRYRDKLLIDKYEVREVE